VILSRVAGFIENLVGCMGGEALIVQVDRESGECPQFGGKCLGLDGLRTHFAGEMDGVADHNGNDGEAAGKTGQGTQVVAGIAMPLQGQDRLGGEA